MNGETWRQIQNYINYEIDIRHRTQFQAIIFFFLDALFTMEAVYGEGVEDELEEYMLQVFQKLKKAKNKRQARMKALREVNEAMKETIDKIVVPELRGKKYGRKHK